MKKNGAYFLSIVNRESLKPATWDPYCYREKKQSQTLGYFASVQPLKATTVPRHAFKFAPLEYRHIGRGRVPAFTLESSSGGLQAGCHGVVEGALLFGTMRAYLGNVVITPRAEWIGEQSPFIFAVKSEFVQIVPKDGLVYFWWAYLQSQSFLHSLPIGTGGTRPRLHGSALAQTPVEVPTKDVRESIHAQIQSFAASLWSQYMTTERLLENTIGL
jgi:hypothetical protein